MLCHEDHNRPPSDDQQQVLHAITAVFTSPDVAIPIDMLILFGSRARGDWVDDQETGYRSDYDPLVVVENEKQVNDLTVGNLNGRCARSSGTRHLRSSFTTSSS